jgi:hypothetical protein
MSWPPEDTSPVQNGPMRVRPVDDFRLSEWFIGGATSPKDLAILVDGGSLYSSKTRNLIVATANTILDSLGPNDFVNVYRYGESAKEIVTCFKDVMMIASSENIKELKVRCFRLRQSMFNAEGGTFQGINIPIVGGS